MLFFYSFFITICIFYFIIILFFVIGWSKIETYRNGKTCLSGFFITVIVPFKNEEINLPHLINSLSNQTLTTELFEILLIDDNSSDGSWDIAHQNILDKQNFRCIKSLEKSGKKNAIKFAVKISNGDLIVTTDADCVHHPKWLETIYSFYCEKKAKLIIGPVIMNGNNSFEKMQSLDFFSLMASGAGACGLDHPIMCNGANLAFEKKVFNELNDPLNLVIESGDDIFLMHNIKRSFPNEVAFLKSERAIVNTCAEKAFGSFVKQRIRWASKSKAYKDLDTIITALIVFSFNLLLFITLTCSLINSKLFYLFAIQIITKSLIDFLLIYKVSSFYKITKLLYFFIPTQFLNIIFIPIIAVLGILVKVKWKNIK